MRYILLATAVAAQMSAFVPASATAVIQPAPAVAPDEALVARLIGSVSNPQVLERVIAGALAGREAIAVIVAVEQAVGVLAVGQPLLAEALVRQATRLIAVQDASTGVQLAARTAVIIAVTDPASASRLIMDAIPDVGKVDDGAAIDLGAAASIVATTAALQGDAATSLLVTSVVETSNNSVLSGSFMASGGNSGTSASEMLAATQSVSSINPAIGGDVSAQDGQPRDVPQVIGVPLIVEPNPQQAASPV